MNGIKLTNNMMKAGRYGRWARARKLYATIQTVLAQGGMVQVSTITHVTRYTAKHAGMFECTKNDVTVARGKSRDSLYYSTVRFYGA